MSRAKFEGKFKPPGESAAGGFRSPRSCPALSLDDVLMQELRDDGWQVGIFSQWAFGYSPVQLDDRQRERVKACSETGMLACRLSLRRSSSARVCLLVRYASGSPIVLASRSGTA